MIRSRLPRVACPLVAFAFVLAHRADAQGFELWRATSTVLNDQYGHSLAAVDDVDGDGFRDLLVGAVLGSPGAGHARVHVLSGRSGAPLAELADVSTTSGIGHAMAAFPDVDGDGRGDWLISAPASVGTAKNGTVSVYSSATKLPLLQVNGAQANEQFGRAVVALGDVDGDGAPDFAASTVESLTTGASKVRVHSGTSGALLAQWLGQPQKELGRALANAGDLDGDGVDELLAGATATSGPGAVYVLATTGAAALKLQPGNFFVDFFGMDVAGVGDVDLDGTPDFAVSAPGQKLHQVAQAGQVYLYSGATLAPIAAQGGASSSDLFGWHISACPDANGDGITDLLVGTQSWLGPGYSRVHALPGFQPLLVLPHESTTNAGSSPDVAVLDDMTEDGMAEFAIARTPQAAPNVSHVGVWSRNGWAHALEPFGSGCDAAPAPAPRLSSWGGQPKLGNAAFTLAAMLAWKPAATDVPLLFLAGDAAPSALPILGCDWWLDASAQLVPTPGLTVSSESAVARLALVPFPIPNVPALAGARVVAQCAWIGPTAPNGLFRTTNALRVIAH